MHVTVMQRVTVRPYIGLVLTCYAQVITYLLTYCMHLGSQGEDMLEKYFNSMCDRKTLRSHIELTR